MERHPKYSVIIPVYNRPDEVEELLQSLSHQTYTDFEVIIVEDGSQKSCDHVTALFREQLTIKYYYKQNEGPGPARNMGFTQASGKFFVVFDSDCIIPPDYFFVVDQAIQSQSLDAWGGPDKPHQNFTPVQRAMGYTMSSILTTGGIRGGKKHVGWFQPRSFNMGMSRGVFEKTGGFHFSRFAEDIELSIRMKKLGFRVALIPDAFVYHKRRTSFGQFFKQVFNFGRGRALVGKVHPEEVKLTHWFPTVFTLGFAGVFVTPFLGWNLTLIGMVALTVYFGLIFIHSYLSNRNLVVAFLSIPSAFLQLTGYGLGFLQQRFSPPPSSPGS